MSTCTRDLENSATALRDWLGTKLLGVTDLVVSEVIVPPPAGAAAATVMFRAAWNRGGLPGGARYVAKVSPQDERARDLGQQRGPRHDLVTERWVMQALAVHSAAPVPTTPWVEVDAGVLGAPFLVMERLPGRPVGRHGELSTAQRATVGENALTALAQLHAVDHAGLGLDFLDRPEFGADPLEQVLTRWRSAYDWVRAGQVSPAIEAGFAWLTGNRPESGPIVLTWGDARLGNLLLSDDLAVTAVLNWELSALGPRELDLAWWLHTTARRFPDVDRAATIDRYTELTGHQIRDFEYYERFAALRLAILTHRADARPAYAGSRCA